MEASDELFVAFFSYVRRNDEHDKGRLTYLRKLLENELWAQTGKDLKIFQDTEDIQWGTEWIERTTSILDRSAFLIAIVTPGYLESKWCRFEFEYYLKQESQFKHKLILPILYIDTPRLKDKNDEVAIEISKRQCIDWRDLRFVSLPSTKITKRLEILARQIRDLISDEVSIIDKSKRDSEFPPNSVVSAITEAEFSQTIDSERAKLPSLYVPLAREDKDHPPRQITAILRSTGDKEYDRRRIKTIYGTLISFLGRDRFSFQIFANGRGHLIDFPDDTTRVCPELLERLKKLMGEANCRVEDLTLQ